MLNRAANRISPCNIDTLMNHDNDAASSSDGHRIARDTVYNLLGRGLPLVVGLATTPFIVRFLGEERFGLFSIGFALISSFFVFDMGLGRAVAKYGAAYRVSQREAEIPLLIWSAVGLQAVLGTLGGLLLAALTPYLVSDVFVIPEALESEARQVFYLLAATIVLSLLEFSFAGALEAYQRFGLLNAVRAPINVISLLVVVWVAWMDGGLPLFFGLFLVSRFILIGLLFVACSRTVPDFLRRMAFSIDGIRPLFHFGKWVTLSNMLAPALMYADRFLLGTIGSMGQVAYYAAPFQVVERLLIIPGTLSSTLFPTVSALESGRATKQLQALSLQAIHFLVCIMGLMGVVLAAGAPWIVWVFFGEEYLAHSVSVFRILLLGVAVNGVAFIPDSVVQGCGRPDMSAKFHLIEFPIHLVFLIGGYHVGGLAGVAFAWTARVSLDCALLLFYCHLRGWIDGRALLHHRAARNALVLLGTGLAVSQLSWGAPPLHLAGAAILVTALVAYIYRMGLSPMERASLWQFVGRRTGRRKEH